MKDENFEVNDRVLRLEKGKRGLLRVIFGRIGIIISLLMLQIILFALLVKWLDGVTEVWFGSAAISLIVIIKLINDNENPTAKLTWVMLIMLVPLFGVLLYLYVKTDLGHRMIRNRLAEIQQETKDFLNHEENDIPDELVNVSNYLDNFGFPTYKGCDVKYFPSGESKFEEVLEQLEKAQKFIFMEYFIIDEGYMWGRILDVLERKVKEGVKVRVMYDGTCAVFRLPYDYPKKLQKLGIECKMFSPLRPFVSTHYNYRDHRKILVIDGKIAFTGGINFADTYINKIRPFGHWKDTAVMIKGKAVESFTLMFLQMWSENINAIKRDCKKYILDIKHYENQEWVASQNQEIENDQGYVIPYGDQPFDDEKVAEMVYLDIFNTAKKYVHVMTPYLILDNEMLTAMLYAAKRGVEVYLILPYKPDKKSAFALAHTHYKQLIENGIKIYEYMPGFCHAKMFTSDDCKAVVGSINLDYRSLYHHFECALYMHDEPVIKDIEADFEETLKECREVTLKSLKNVPFTRRAAGKLLKILAPLM